MSATREPHTLPATSRSGEFTARELALLAEKAPEAYRDLMAEKRLDQRHLRRIAWAGFIAQTVGHLCGLIALAVLAVVAWHAFDLGDATQGAAIICTGAVSIVAVFVTGRLVGETGKGESKNSNLLIIVARLRHLAANGSVLAQRHTRLLATIPDNRIWNDGILTRTALEPSR